MTPPPQQRRWTAPTVHRRTLLTALSGAAMAPLLGKPAAAATFTAKLVPSRGVLLGAYVAPGVAADTDQYIDKITSLERSIGRKLAIDHHYYAWQDPFPTHLEHWDVNGGRIPMISWEPFGVSLRSIAKGEEDWLLVKRAKQFAGLGAPVFLRFAHEMNMENYPWSLQPYYFVAAWRHIRNVLHGNGATNVVMVWTPNSEDVPRTGWNHWTEYYPGDAYVDWVGIDGYNFGNTKSWSTWRPLSEVIAQVYKDYASRKPIMIAETACTESGGDKAAWIREIAQDLRGFPAVKALVYFAGKSLWPPTSSSSALDAFRDLAQDPYFTVTPAQTAGWPT